ncbi:hypothetical protein IJ750_04540 [bacterium]|nr:hypothetical protein [bacterium]
MGKKSQKTTSKTVYGNTTTTNPYVTATTNNNGTVANFQPGTAFEAIYNNVNRDMGNLLEEYLNPTLNSVTNRAKLNTFNDALAGSTRQNLENNIINPLSNRNMLRSSQAADLYKNLSNQNNASLDSYISSLLSESQDNTARMMSNLLTMYMQGLGALNDVQNQSLQTSSGNATRTNTTKTSSDTLSDLSRLVSVLSETFRK